jgi:chemotaxis protein MotD
MSRFDILSQTAPRLADAPSARNASPLPDAQDGGGEPGRKDFGSLLEGFSRPPRKQDASAVVQGMVSPVADQDILSELTAAKSDSLKALLPEPESDNVSSDAANAQQVVSVVSLLEGFLPRILSQASGVADTKTGQEGSSTLLAASLLSGQELNEDSLASAGSGSKLMVTVQHQETHFRPIIEELGIKVADTDIGTPEEDPHPIAGEGPLEKSKDTATKTLQFDRRALSIAGQPDPVPNVTAKRPPDVQAGTDKVSLDGFAERMEARKQMAQEGLKVDGASLPVATLHRIAGAILDDVAGSAAGSPQSSSHNESVNRLTLTRASDGVLRVLNLQLHPAELGVVTIKMKLAGESLEMELHAEREETAQLLRNDADKLSSLLKGSGYRPDVITVHSVEASSNDRSAPQRSPQGTQSQDQAFQQGAANQGGHSRQRGEQYARERTGVRKDAKEDVVAGSSSPGGVYL